MKTNTTKSKIKVLLLQIIGFVVFVYTCNTPSSSFVAVLFAVISSIYIYDFFTGTPMRGKYGVLEDTPKNRVRRTLILILATIGYCICLAVLILSTWPDLLKYLK